MTEFHSVLDNAITTLDGGIDDDDLVINVIDGSKFPLTVDCPLILTIEANTANMEKVLITANAANVLTVDASGRGYEGSVAKSHASGVKIELLYVATNITELQGAVNALENGVVNKADFNATTFLYATSDDTPQPKTPAEVMAILSGQAAATFSMNTHKITGVVDPTAAQEAATKKYVDDLVNYHPPSITVEYPAADDALIVFFTFVAITIAEIQAAIVGGTSVTFQIYHNTTLATAIAGTEYEVLDDPEVITASENFAIGVMDDYTIPADSYVVLYITDVSGAVTQFHVSMIYTKD